jgi:hypothetical protein
MSQGEPPLAKTWLWGIPIGLHIVKRFVVGHRRNILCYEQAQSAVPIPPIGYIAGSLFPTNFSNLASPDILAILQLFLLMEKR